MKSVSPTLNLGWLGTVFDQNNTAEMLLCPFRGPDVMSPGSSCFHCDGSQMTAVRRSRTSYRERTHGEAQDDGTSHGRRGHLKQN